jgi:hypothetical protein
MNNTHNSVLGSYDIGDPSIYYEALWVIALFAATAVLREAVGEMCVHFIAKRIILVSCKISGKTLDTLVSCSNGGRSLGFGAAWRLWNIDNTYVVRKRIIVLPLLCWVIGMPIKLVAVQAVRGGNAILGYWGTWALGISWLSFCIFFKLITMVVDKFYGIRDRNGKIISYRKIFQARLCTFEAFGMMISPNEYNESKSFIHPTLNGLPLSITIEPIYNGDTICTLKTGIVRSDEIYCPPYWKRFLRIKKLPKTDMLLSKEINNNNNNNNHDNEFKHASDQINFEQVQSV